VVDALVAALDNDPALQGVRPIDAGALATAGPAAANA
jgi:hypothetical protein